MRFLLLLLWSFFYAGWMGATQVNPAQTKTVQEVSQWEVTEISLQAQQQPADPYAITVGAKFRHSNGRTLDIPAFYDGGSTYRIRFSPPEAGQWEYTTYASLPDLAGRTGQLSVTEAEDEPGPLMIDPENPQKFVYGNGEPAFVNSFELDWLFALDYDNPDGIPKTEALVRHLKENGVNQIILNVYAYDATWGEKELIKSEHNFARPTAFPWGGTNEQPDHSVLNHEFFQRLDRVIAYLNEENMLAHLMIYVWNKQVKWPELGSAADDRYFQQVIKRYQAYPNVLWNFGKEALSYDYTNAEHVAMRMRQLQQLDGHDRLMTVHDFDFFDHYPDLVDYVAIQSWTENIYGQMSLLRETFPNKPIFNIEHGAYVEGPNAVFEGSYTDPVVSLERNYKCAFAGAYSNHYWQNMAWYQIIYNPWNQPESEQPHLEYIRYMTDFFEEQNFNELSPNPDFSVGYNLVNADSTHYLFFLPAGGQVHGGMGASFAGKTVSIQYYDPLTGTYSETTDREQKSGWLKLESPVDWSIEHFRLAVLKVID